MADEGSIFDFPIIIDTSLPPGTIKIVSERGEVRVVDLTPPVEVLCSICGRPFSVTRESDGRVLASMPHRRANGRWCEGEGERS